MPAPQPHTVRRSLFMPPMWMPSDQRARSTNLYRFMQTINQRFGTSFTEYEPLWQWSVDNVADLWATLWDELDVIASQPCDRVIDDVHAMPGANWFAGAHLNFAQNLLRFRDDQAAIIFRGETMHESRTLTYRELSDAVSRLAQTLRAMGVQAGDRVVGFMPNMPETIIAMLAATASAPSGLLLARLRRQGRARPLPAHPAEGALHRRRTTVTAGGRSRRSRRCAEIFTELSPHPQVVVVPYTEDRADISIVPGAAAYED
jgi:acetoacetyl-CoA synthetase